MKKLFWLLAAFYLNAVHAQTLEIVSGTPQLDVSPAAQQPLVVRARDAGGNPIAGQGIVWLLQTGVSSSTGTFDGTAITFNAPNNLFYKASDAQGLNSVVFANGAQPNAAVAVAACFAAGTPAAPSISSPCITGSFIVYQPNLTFQSGNNQTGPAGLPLPQPLSVRVTPTANSTINPAPAGIAGITVNWQTFTTANPTPVSLGSIVSDANGFANLSFTPPDASPGRTVRAFVTSNNAPAQAQVSFSVNVQTPTLSCAPAHASNSVPVAQAVALTANCTVNGQAAVAGTETWTFPATASPVINGVPLVFGAGQPTATLTRTLPGAPPLQVAYRNAGTFTPTVSYAVGGTTSAVFNAPITVTPPPAVACAPTVSPASPVSGQAFTINGNCTVNGVAATAGTENWTIPAIGSQPPVNVNRVLPATPIQRVISTPGNYSLSLQFTSPSGDSPVYAVPITVAQNPATAAPTAQDIRAVQSTIAAATNTAVRGIHTQFDLIQRRFQYIRSGGPGGFVSDVGLNASVNGRSLPLPGTSSGGSEGKQGESQGQSSSSSGASATARSEEAEGTRTGRWGAYIMGGIDIQKLKGEGGFKIGTNGLTAGADYRVNRSMVVGGALGYMKSDTDFVGSTSGQKADGLSVTLYGSFEPAPAWFVDAGFSSSRNNFDLRRATSTGGTALANTKGTGTGLTLSAGYTFKRDGWLFSPYGRVDTLRVNIGEFNETGDTPLFIGEQGLKSSVLTAGATAQYVISTGYGVVIPQARLELQRQTQNSVRSVTARLVGSSVQVVVDPGLGVDKSFGQFGLGISAQLKRGVSLFADYEQGFGKSSFSEYRASTGLKVEF